MKEDKEVFDQYRIESEIGRGASGVCYRVQHSKTREVFAMKKIHISSIKKQNPREACSEVAILSKLDHPHIIKLHQTFTDQNHLYIIMQFAPKGDLHHILKRRKIRRDIYSEGQVWEMTRQILSALQYLHSRSIIHRDVKTLNIFMDSQGKLYLGDLGVSKILKTDNGLYSRVGTPLYLAPEIIKYEKYDYKADIWGLGCVCYQLAGLTHPFEGKNIITLGQSIVNVQPKPLPEYSPQLNCLILDMLEKTPAKRLSAAELLIKYFKEGIPLAVKQPEVPLTSQKQQQLPQKQQQFSQKQQQFPQRQNDRSYNFLKSNQIRRKIVNNFLEQKIVFNQSDKIREEGDTGGSIRKVSKPQEGSFVGSKEILKTGDRNMEDTVVFSKKSKEENKKYVEATHKSYAMVNSYQSKDSFQWIKRDKEIERQKPKYNGYCRQPFFQEKKNTVAIEGPKTVGMVSFSSEKRMPAIPPHVQNSKLPNRGGLYTPCFSTVERRDDHKKTDVSLMGEQHKKTEMSFSDINRLSSENQLPGPSKIARIRPKSSIMTKQRHESTMKNIKKSVRRMDVDDMDRFVETRVLKRPEMIIL